MSACAHDLATSDPADHTLSVGSQDVIVLQNYDGIDPTTGDKIIAPIRVMRFSHPPELVAPIIHTGAQATRPATCHDDARAVYDATLNVHFVITVGPAAYCIGVGDGDPNHVWVWNVIPWNGHAGDGAWPALTTTEFLAHGTGDLLRCTKSSLVFGVPSCFWQSTAGLHNVIPVRSEYGTSTGYFVGFQDDTPGQITVGYTDGTPLQAIYLGSLFGYDGSFQVHTPSDTQTRSGFALADAVYDATRDTLWIEFHGRCFWSGAHACVGAMRVQLHPYPVALGLYDFDTPTNVLDGYLGSMSVDHAGYAMLTWVASASWLAPSMALAGISPTGLMGWRIQHVGAGGGYGHPDFTGVGCIPGTNACIAHGLHNQAYQTADYLNPIGYRFASDIDVFNHCCDPATGSCPRAGCP